VQHECIRRPRDGRDALIVPERHVAGVAVTRSVESLMSINAPEQGRELAMISLVMSAAFIRVVAQLLMPIAQLMRRIRMAPNRRAARRAKYPRSLVLTGIRSTPAFLESKQGPQRLGNDSVTDHLKV